MTAKQLTRLHEQLFAIIESLSAGDCSDVQRASFLGAVDALWIKAYEARTKAERMDKPSAGIVPVFPNGTWN